nr:prepilin-type N-terminal cleavage/methylation domain-containing protein [Leifsonia psychrotolerans]
MSERRQNLAPKSENEKGFTLIELLVVVIIIGILAAIAIPVFLNQRQSAWQASVGSDLKNAAIVVETYGTTNNGSYALFPGDKIAVKNVKGTMTGGVAGGSENIKVSDGNTVTVTIVDNTKYTIVGVNSNVDGTQTYDSSLGGLQKWVGKK